MHERLSCLSNGAIGQLTFNRPAVFNAMNEELMLALRDKSGRQLSSTTLRVLVVKGAGKAFIAGGDVGLFHQRKEVIADEIKPLGDALHAAIINFRNLPFPVIAQIHGAVAGAGLSLALACDFAIADDSAQFTTAYARIGLSPDGGSTYFLPRIVGMKKAAEMIMLSDTLNAAQALEFGLVNRVVTADRLQRKQLLAERRLAAPRAFAHAKRLITQSARPWQHLDDNRQL
jgi:2-(1,2-epoxy-1,2-dihydrophenyl)acetyl-CoA isomerase